MTFPHLEILLRAPDYSLIDRLDMWISLTAISRFNKVGTWDLEIPRVAKIADRVTEDTGIVIRRNGVTIFSGSPTTSFIETKDTLKWSGTDDNVLLETVARPTPSLAVGPYPDAYDVRTGVASTVMIDLVKRNIGALAPTSPVNWKISQLLTLTDPLLGSAITSRARFDPLITLLAELASTPVATGLGFRILQSDTVPNLLEFSIYEPRDKHVDTVFSLDLHTIEDFERVHQPAGPNYFMVGGGDDFGLNRTVVEGGDSAAIAAAGRVIPVFVDRRGVVDLAELEQELAEQIATVISLDAVTVTPSRVESLTYGPDWDLGDYVTAVVNGTSYARLITEIEHSFNATEGITIKPMIADPGASNDSTDVQHMNTLAARLSNIERNWNVPNDSIIEDMLHPTMKWYPGDVKVTGRSSAQLGWLLCDGAAISRSTYPRLFAAIGTTYGVGNGSTTFNIPDFRDRFPLGKGTVHSSLGATGGTTTLSIAHVHSHSHGLNNHTHAGQTHTHPLTHSHGLTTHDHVMAAHVHNFTDTHGHGLTDGPSSDTGRDTGGLNVATNFHWHTVGNKTINADTGTANPTTTDAGLRIDNNASFSSTENDSNVGSASYSGSASAPSPNSSETDNSAAASPNTVTSEQPYLVVNYEIWTGVTP